MKTCNRCEILQELSEYHKHKDHKDGLSNICKTCIRKTISTHNATEKAKETRRKYREKTKGKRAEYYKQYNKSEKRIAWIRNYNRINKLKLYYGLTYEKYCEMIIEQDNKCKICKEELSKPNVDHCHKSGKIRGLLCRGCNHGLGNFRDNQEFLLRAKEYLDESI